MEKSTIFRDRQEFQSKDLVALNGGITDSLDHVVADGLQHVMGWVNFQVLETGVAELTVKPGRVYNGGAVYAIESDTVINLIPELPALNSRWLAIVGYGSTSEVDIEPRDFLIDVETGATEPQAVPMTRLRRANVATVYGVAAPQPMKPSVGAGNVIIAWVLIDPTGVVSIALVESNRLANVWTERNRVDELTMWRTITGPRVDSLASDIAAIKAMLAQRNVDQDFVEQIAIDVARVKEALEIDESGTAYDADRFLDENESDVENVNFLARVDEGIRFSHDAHDERALQVFNPINPDVKISNGFLLPAYTETKRFHVFPMFESLSISQFAYDSYQMVQKSIARQRIRYGESTSVCTNSSWWKSGRYDATTGIFSRAGETWEVYYASGKTRRLRRIWIDTWTEYYWERQTTEYTINGQQVAQTFLNAADGWLTSIALFFTQAGTDGNVDIALTEVIHGMPNLGAVLNKVTLNVGDIKTSGDGTLETRVPIPATFLEAGKRYAIVVTTGGNHHVAMAQGTQYAQGSFFVSVDGAYQMGTATKDMMFALYFAKFTRNRTTVELQPMSLSGGISDLDILAPILTPGSCDLTFEIQVGGIWHPLAEVETGNTPLYGLPALLPFRATFTGTPDVAPGIDLAKSRLIFFRPRTTAKHITTLYTLDEPSDSFKVVGIIENYKEDNHNCDVRLLIAGVGSEIAPASVVDVELDPPIDARSVDHKRIRRTWVWTDAQIASPMSTFKLVTNMTTSSALDTFHFGERVHLAY